MSTTTKELTTADIDLSNPSRDNVPKWLEIVAKKLNELKGDAPEKAGTKTAFPGFDKIEDIDSVESLVKIYSAVSNRAAKYKEAAETLNVPLKKYPFKIEGHTAEEWMNDVKFRITQVKNKKDIERLQKVQTTLSKYLSEEDKLKRDLEQIGSELIDEMD